MEDRERQKDHKERQATVRQEIINESKKTRRGRLKERLSREREAGEGETRVAWSNVTKRGGVRLVRTRFCFFTESLRVWRECKYRGSIFVDCIYCCDMRVSWRPGASLRGLGS